MNFVGKCMVKSNLAFVEDPYAPGRAGVGGGHQFALAQGVLVGVDGISLGKNIISELW